MAKSVFFSYAREDSENVSTVAESIRSAGFTPFFDRHILGGEQWWDRLLTEIESCDAFVPVLSSSYLRSVPCRIEVSYAVELGKPLVPLDIGAGTLFGAAFIEPIKAAQWVAYDHDAPMSSVLMMIGAINNAPPAPAVPAEVKRPPAPGSDVLSTTVRLVGSASRLTATEQWAVVGELRAHMRGENSAAARALLESFVERTDLLASVHRDAQLMFAEMPAHPLPPGRPQPPAPSRVEEQQPGPLPVANVPAGPPKSQPNTQPEPDATSSDTTPPVKPNDYRVWSIVMVVLGVFPGSLLPLPFAIVALWHSMRVGKRWTAGDALGATEASRRVRRWTVMAAAVLVGVLVMMIESEM